MHICGHGSATREARDRDGTAVSVKGRQSQNGIKELPGVITVAEVALKNVKIRGAGTHIVIIVTW